jgi:hypothetical protein
VYSHVHTTLGVACLVPRPLPCTYWKAGVTWGLRVHSAIILRACNITLILIPVFSPAYLRDIGPISLRCSVFFDVGLGVGPKPLMWTQTMPFQYAFNLVWGEHYCGVWRPRRFCAMVLVCMVLHMLRSISSICKHPVCGLCRKCSNCTGYVEV